MLLNRRCLTVPAGLLLSFVMTGCGGTGDPNADGPAGGPGAASGSVIVDGSSTVYRISVAAQESFQAVNPNVSVVVDNHGTGGGFSRYLQGEVDIVDASRDAKPDEESKAKAQGIDWTRFVVGYDGITLVVNPKNTFLQSITVEQLKKLWEPGSTVKKWKDLDPSWPDRDIIFYSPDNDSGTFEFFTEAVIGKSKQQRTDVQPNSDDNMLVNGIARDEDGVGYFGYAYYEANKEKLRAVPIQNGADATPVLPSPETIGNKTYAPLSRPLFIFVKNSASRRPEMKEFLTHYLTNVEKLSVLAKYDPPSKEEIAENQDRLAKLIEGKPVEASSTPAATGTEAPAAKE